MTSNKSLRASAYTDEAIGATEHALESTRQFANQAFEKAGEKVRDLRYGVKDLASRSASSVSDATAVAQRYVAERPVQSALIAAAIGAAVAALVLAMRRNSDKRYY